MLLSALLWSACVMAFWYLGGDELGASLGLGPAPAETEPIIGVSVFWSDPFLWFYIVYAAAVALFAGVWLTFSPHPCRRGITSVGPQPILMTEWIKPGALVVPYGTMSAIEITLTDIMSKLVVDDWGQCKGGKFGSLRAHVEAGKLSEATLHAELGQIVAGLKPGRETGAETILLWHRGLSISDIALGHAMLAKAARLGIGQRLRFA